tara:strand:- start:116 stop:235 length:120 start_codon:yes stop_codon:yes gene_type:complete
MIIVLAGFLLTSLFAIVLIHKLTGFFGGTKVFTFEKINI